VAHFDGVIGIIPPYTVDAANRETSIQSVDWQQDWRWQGYDCGLRFRLRLRHSVTLQTGKHLLSSDSGSDASYDFGKNKNWPQNS
jgi:hypothetical protein